MSEIFRLLQSFPPAFISLCVVLGLIVGSFLNVVIYRLPKMMEREWLAQCAELNAQAAPGALPDSADSTGGFQSRRLNTRVRRANGKIEPVHMNDATMIAAGRTMIGILENYQQKDGSVKIPTVLQPYMNGKKFIGKKTKE